MAANRPRRNPRLTGRDYSSPGAYFVTLRGNGTPDLFGRVVSARMRLNDVGRIVEETWRLLPTLNPYVALDEWCVMPDHFHAIVIIREGPAVDESAPDSDVVPRKSLGRLIGAFKTMSTKGVNDVRGTPGATLWQRSFWDRIIRNDAEMCHVRAYIRNNPARYRAHTFTVPP
jgi:putative transposase